MCRSGVSGWSVLLVCPVGLSCWGVLRLSGVPSGGPGGVPEDVPEGLSGQDYLPAPLMSVSANPDNRAIQGPPSLTSAPWARNTYLSRHKGRCEAIFRGK